MKSLLLLFSRHLLIRLYLPEIKQYHWLTVPKLFAAKALTKNWPENISFCDMRPLHQQFFLSAVSRMFIHDGNIVLSALTFSGNFPAGFFELLKICVIIPQLYATEF